MESGLKTGSAGALNAARPGPKHGPAAHTVSGNSDVAHNFKAAPTAQFYSDMKLKMTTVSLTVAYTSTRQPRS